MSADGIGLWNTEDAALMAEIARLATIDREVSSNSSPADLVLPTTS
jgi:hypothetical protein